MTLDKTIGFIGGGNMAKAIAVGILKQGLVTRNQIIVSAPSESTLEGWKELSARTTCSNADVINSSDIIILAFKPQQLDLALTDIHYDLNTSMDTKLFVSVLAGVSSDVIYEKLLFYGKLSSLLAKFRLIRVMPNTLALICEGCSALAAHKSATPEDVKIVQKIFCALGKCEIVPEYLIPAVTGLSGSGPAYVYMVIEALSDGGVKQGLPRSLANTFAAQTVFGAAKMVLETEKHTSQLKDEVCSAGGTTIHAVHALEKGNLRATLMNAVEAAANRAEEISSLSKS